MAVLSNIITPTNVLTASSTNTLTNKTIAFGSNTLTDVASTNTAQTLSSKTFKADYWFWYDSGSTAALNINNGNVQRWAPTASSNPTLSISNWPASGTMGELFIEGVNLGAAGTITWPTINWITSTGATTTTFSANGVTLQSSGTDWCMLWTRDGGTTIYGKFIR